MAKIPPTSAHALPSAASRSVFQEAMRRGDVSAACVVYADDAVLLPPAADFVAGREAIAAFWQAGVVTGLVSVEMDEAIVAERGATAYEIGGYAIHLRPSPSGDSVVERGRYVLVHERQADGAWLRTVEVLAADAGSPGR